MATNAQLGAELDRYLNRMCCGASVALSGISIQAQERGGSVLAGALHENTVTASFNLVFWTLAIIESDAD